MSSSSSQVSRKALGPSEYLDLLLGLRGWGLIIYGSLPANLALIGALEVKLGNIDKLWRYLIPISSLPILLTFLLIRKRLKDWYLTTDFLTRRSAITTFLIVLCSTLISGVSGILHGKYIMSFQNITDRAHQLGMSEAFLFGVSSLVISSTLFMTLLTKESDLPGLPSPKFVEVIGKIRSGLRQVQESELWNWTKYNGNDRITLDLKTKITDVKLRYLELISYPGNSLAKRSLVPIYDNIVLFEKAVRQVEAGGSLVLKEDRWKQFFGDDALLSENQRNERQRLNEHFAAIESIRALKLGA